VRRVVVHQGLSEFLGGEAVILTKDGFGGGLVFGQLIFALHRDDIDAFDFG
jgi:hypothetical protein